MLRTNDLPFRDVPQYRIISGFDCIGWQHNPGSGGSMFLECAAEFARTGTPASSRDAAPIYDLKCVCPCDELVIWGVGFRNVDRHRYDAFTGGGPFFQIISAIQVFDYIGPHVQS